MVEESMSLKLTITPIELRSKGGGRSLADQIVDGVKLAIWKNDPDAGPGEMLPSMDEMAAQHQVHKNTVVEAYKKLASDGITVTQSGIGTFVRNDRTREQLRSEIAIAMFKDRLSDCIHFAAENQIGADVVESTWHELFHPYFHDRREVDNDRGAYRDRRNGAGAASGKKAPRTPGRRKVDKKK